MLKAIIATLLPDAFLKGRLKPIFRSLRAGLNAGRFRRVYYGAQLRAMRPVLMRTGEMSNFTYDLNERNLRVLAETIAVATRRPAGEIAGYIDEVIEDAALREFFEARMQSWDGARTRIGVRSPFGRRLGWYAVARAIKPKVTVETGVDRGHGALILCAALRRNAVEGFPGRYYGTDIDPRAGHLLAGDYAAMGEVLIGDSIQTLMRMDQPIDLFINDSDHSADYEAAEYQIVRPKLAPGAIILGDNAHATDKLARFSREAGRRFLFFREEPQDHWYPGAGIGISFEA